MKLLLLTAALLICASCTTPADKTPSPDPTIPRSALAARQGVGRMFFAATDDGVVYIYDVDSAQFLFATPILKEHRFVLDPQHDRATVEAKVVYEKPLARKHTHRIYFDPHGKMPKALTETKAPAPINVAPSTAPTN